MDAKFSDSLYYAHTENNTLERESVYRNPSLSQCSVEVAPRRSGKDNKVYNVLADSGTHKAGQGISTENQVLMSSVVEGNGISA